MRKSVLYFTLGFMLIAIRSPADAQQPAKMPRIAWLMGPNLSAEPDRIEAFRDGLRALGYVEGKTIVIEIECSSDGLQMELWNNGKPIDLFEILCGNKKTLTITPNNLYFLSLAKPEASEDQYTNYILNLEAFR